jgi:type IV secretory pathway VirJ component
MARALAGRRDTLVVGIDIVYLKQLRQSRRPCLYLAADFEALSKYIQKRLDYRQYVQPVPSGATLVYALLCQAPANTFKGGLSMGFLGP